MAGYLSELSFVLLGVALPRPVVLNICRRAQTRSVERSAERRSRN